MYLELNQKSKICEIDIFPKSSILYISVGSEYIFGKFFRTLLISKPCVKGPIISEKSDSGFNN